MRTEIVNLNKLLFWTLLIGISACSTATNNERQSNQEPDTIVVKSTELATIEVTDTTDELTKQSKYPFSNSAYTFSSDFDLANCTAMNRCDCCTSETFFIDSINYYNASYCEGTTYFTKGTYSVDGNEIFMKSTVLVEIEFDYDTYEPTGDTIYMELPGESYYAIDSCNSRIMLISSPDPPSSYGLLTERPSQQQSYEIIKMLNGRKD
ncbi:hypothetical protein AAOE16_00995 [Ekhidna sp. MALMAid0563]|uniref:hypothetical protein n=1 Tax=Ekhidna sp. MALMAid0563 TaxID=3143937 RepID=UPI0032E02117